MKYSNLLLPVAATAATINLLAPNRLGIRDRVATDRFRTFASNESFLPHSVKPYSIDSYRKRDNHKLLLADDGGNEDKVYDSKKEDSKKDENKKDEDKKDEDKKDEDKKDEDKKDEDKKDEDKKDEDKKDDSKEIDFYDPEMFEKPGPMSELCKNDVHIIETSGDLYHLQAQCDTLLGSIHFANYADALIDFGNIQSVKGSIYVEKSSHLVKIEGSKLQAVGETFSLQSLTSLVSINLPYLKEARVIDWKVLPILNEALINENLGGLKSLTISDTSLSTIEGFKNVEDVEIFQVNNNRFLETVKANIQYVRQKLSVHANARETELEMPKLISAENITVRDTSLAYFPKLETVGSSFELIQNQFSEMQVPNLKTIGGTLGIIDNVNLKLANFRNVTDIEGGLMIANNTKLEKIDFFTSLKQIGGAIYFEGKFSDTDFPQLKLVKGSALIKTNSGQMDCSKWTTPKNGRSIVRGGKITCTSGRRQKSQSVSQDGAVLSETVEDHESDGDSGNDSKGGFFSNNSRSSDAKLEKPNLSWVLCVALLAIGHNFL
ncbi:hypothetical protein HG536_0B00420 [Torulaspora globosa]|uniref:Receptor L-domain domain-containing protein n=1 Tax=Torulaspora globosa TaxID=48254 RepID=A0A7G3ZCE5_9SACH|nr:uncharacterized protein HG536_0B00420 [Torulaspora globosa]QLL31181.1 hypothetical protein HG536_0B00420 [Torulaspora globosa]